MKRWAQLGWSVERPRAIVSDVVMPRMGGRELARQIDTEFPGLPVLFVSGYSGEEAVGRGLIDPGQPFLQKPFSGDELVLRLSALLEEHVLGTAGGATMPLSARPV